MVKNITTILINSSTATKRGDDNRNYSFSMDIPPVEIRGKAILKVANFSHYTNVAEGNHNKPLYVFKIRGVNVNNSKFHYNIGGDPVILTTPFNNSRSLYEENEITLTRQTINNIEIIVETIEPLAYVSQISIINSGNGYTSGSNYDLLLSGGGDGARATGIVGIGNTGFTNVRIDYGGLNYSNLPTVSVRDPGVGTGANFKAGINYGTTIAGIANNLNFSMTLRIEEEQYE